MSKKPLQYNAESIDVQLGLDAVRQSPQIYIASLDSDGIFHLLKEAIDNATDEAKQKAVKDKTIGIITEENSFWVFDFGRGIPVEKHKTTKISTLTTIMTTLSSGGKMRSGDKAGYEKTAGIHGVGISVANALSTNLEVWTCRENQWYWQAFKKGKPVNATPTKVKVPAIPVIKGSIAAAGFDYNPPKCGTIIRFTPDYALFDKGSHLSLNKLREFLQLSAYLHPQTKFVWARRNRHFAKNKVYTYQQPTGLSAFIIKQLKELTAEPTGKTFEWHSDTIDIALAWSDAIDEATRSFVNSSPTKDGGTHVLGLNQAIAEALMPFKPKAAQYRAEDLRTGLVGAINIKIDRPRFTNQTKEKLGMVEVTEQVRRELIVPLTKYFTANKPMVREIIRRAVEERKAQQELKFTRNASAKLKTTKAGKTMLPAKLTTSLTNNPELRELFLVEGDGAGGTAKEARFRETQEILPLTGKILNVIRASPDKIVSNIPVLHILQAIGYDPTNKIIGKYRVGKVIFLADSDPDGEHIALLLSGVLFKILRPLIDAGKVYCVDAPLFTTQVGAKRFYGATLKAVQKQLPNNQQNIPITRIKGWGEINADVLRQVAFDPKTRKLKRLLPVKGRRLRRFISVLDSDTSFRKELLGIN